MAAKELRKYELASAKKPLEHPLLSGVVRLLDSSGRVPRYITFSESLVDAVGHALPHGLTPGDPAYLKVMPSLDGTTWLVFASYLHREESALLWETDEKPSWV